MNDKDERRAQEIQRRVVAVLEENLRRKTTGNQIYAACVLSHSRNPGDEFYEHVLDDIVWLMQQFITISALLQVKCKRIEELKDSYRKLAEKCEGKELK